MKRKTSVLVFMAVSVFMFFQCTDVRDTKKERDILNSLQLFNNNPAVG